MPSILIIDDDDDLREVIAGELKERGYAVRQARDGGEGLAIFRATPSDVVLTDLLMPHKAGISTVVELQNELPQPGIIAMSAYLDQRSPHHRKLTALGATRTLQKPFRIPDLLKMIEEVLAVSMR